MKDQEIHTCSLCGVEVSENDSTFTRDYEVACYGCEEAEMNYASRCLHANEDGVEMIEFSKNFGDYPEPVKEECYKHTSAWRGYTYWIYEDGFELVEDGWITGYADSTTQRKVELSDLYDMIRNKEAYPPCDMWWLFGVTSNIFSQSSDIVIRFKDKEIFISWLETLSFTIAKLHYALG